MTVADVLAALQLLPPETRLCIEPLESGCVFEASEWLIETWPDGSKSFVLQYREAT